MLHAPAHPVRRGIVRKLLAYDGMSCRKACEALSPSTVSFQHRVLREAGLIRSEKRGVEVTNTVRSGDLEQRFTGLLSAVLAHCASNP